MVLAQSIILNNIYTPILPQPNSISRKASGKSLVFPQKSMPIIPITGASGNVHNNYICSVPHNPEVMWWGSLPRNRKSLEISRFRGIFCAFLGQSGEKETV